MYVNISMELELDCKWWKKIWDHEEDIPEFYKLQTAIHNNNNNNNRVQQSKLLVIAPGEAGLLTVYHVQRW